MRASHVLVMSAQDLHSAFGARTQRASRAEFSAREARGKIIDQDGREIPEDAFSPGGRVHFDFRHSTANPFAQLTREQRLARLETIAQFLDGPFMLPGTKIRYGLDGIIGLIPVFGDIIATALSLWVVREARALGAPWHIV